MSKDANRIPVIVGVGEVNDRSGPSDAGMDPVQLMAAALRLADADAGGGFLARADRLLVVPQISFRELEVPRLLARELGLPIARIEQAPEASGDTPVRHLNDAANAIRAGEAQVCMVVGGEALRSAARREAAQGDASGPFKRSRGNAPPLQRRYGLMTPSDIYPLYENATRAAWGQTLAEAQAETGEIWALMSQVAEGAEGAWIRRAHAASEIIEPTADNRPIAFPYTKLMVANASVNQGAGFLVTSLAAARDAGVAEHQMVYVGVGAAAHEKRDSLARAEWGVPPSLRVSIRRAMELNEVRVEDLDCVELYSCFPCVPKMARRELGWPLDKPVTVHGGLTFGGGPIGNYMSHATAAMVRRIRRGSRRGLLFANGGQCSHYHTIVLSGTPPPRSALPLSYDFQQEADAERGEIPALTDQYEGRSRIETYTVIYDRSGAPAYGVMLSRALSGVRVISKVSGEDASTIAFLTDGVREPVGREGVTRIRGHTLHFSPLGGPG